MLQGVLIIHSVLAKVEQEQLVCSCTPPPGNVPLGWQGQQRKVAGACCGPFPLMGFLRGVKPLGGWFTCMGVDAQVTRGESMMEDDLLIATNLLRDE